MVELPLALGVLIGSLPASRLTVRFGARLTVGAEYRPEDIALFEREFVEAEQAAYMETAAEDDEIAERMDAGRRALYRQGRSEEGPYQSPMEDGMQHFHEFLRRELDAHIAPR